MVFNKLLIWARSAKLERNVVRCLNKREACVIIGELG